MEVYTVLRMTQNDKKYNKKIVTKCINIFSGIEVSYRKYMFCTCTYFVAENSAQGHIFVDSYNTKVYIKIGQIPVNLRITNRRIIV